jgi:hypothetical protein
LFGHAIRWPTGDQSPEKGPDTFSLSISASPLLTGTSSAFLPSALLFVPLRSRPLARLGLVGPDVQPGGGLGDPSVPFGLAAAASAISR